MTPRGRVRLVLALLVALALGLSFRDARVDSAVADEPIHAAAGVAQVRTGTWLVNVEHPPLAKELYGLAAVLSTGAEGPRLPYRDFLRATRGWLFAPREGVAPDGVLLAARAAASLLFAGLVLASYAAVGGGVPGLVAAALVLGNTALFPHGHLVTTDVPLTLFAVLLAGALRRQDEASRLSTGILAAAWLAAALATKYSAVLLLPLAFLWIAAGAARDREGRRRRLVLAVAVPASAVLLLALALAWSVRGEAPGAVAVLGRVYQMAPDDVGLCERVEGVSRGLSRWLFGLLFHLRQADAGRLTFFDGATSHPGPHYHLVALVLKSPATWLAATLAGAVLAARRGGPRAARLFFAAGLLLLAGSLPGPRIGVRHVFPTVAFLTLGAAAALGPRIARLSAWARGALLLVVLSPLAIDRSLGASGLVGRLVGRPVLSDSNLDWGQDLLRLRNLLGARGIPPGEVSIVYFGGDLPAMRIPGCLDHLEADAPLRRYAAVSRQYLLLGGEAAILPGGAPRVARSVSELRARSPRPVGRAGDSIELFEVGPAR
ncbi:MAG: hypothetical protein EDX89_23380 [Acidobacteria bacterium]|nr:MAG: hypothetical protein EDX89_23380 [Acidobacteriota bacterium]